MDKKIYVIDGQRFHDLDGFFQEIASVLTPDFHVCKSLDCFNDVLWGGFGTPDEGFILVWKNADLSRNALGYGLTARLRHEGLENIRQGLTYDEILEREYARIKRSFADYDETFCQEQLRSFEYSYHEMEHRLAQNLQNQGETIFDIVLEIIREKPQIELRLE